MPFNKTQQNQTNPISRPIISRRSQSHIPNCASCCSKSQKAPLLIRSGKYLIYTYKIKPHRLLSRYILYQNITRFLHYYIYITSVCLKHIQIYLPQTKPLHHINIFTRFFPVLLLHNNYTSKPQFFHYFSILSRALYTIIIPYRYLKYFIIIPPIDVRYFTLYFI